MSAYASALIFGLGALLAALGWGAAVGRLCGLRRVDAGLAMALGFALLIIVGGVLNLAGVVTLTATLLLGGGGIVTLLAALTQARLRHHLVDVFTVPGASSAVRVLHGVVLAIVAIHFLGSAHAAAFNEDDDMQAYLMFPAKIAQTGHLGIDPFSGRRNESGLGGSYFLGATQLFFTDARASNLMDAGIGGVVLWAVFAGLLRAWRVRGHLGVLLLFILAIVPPPRVNVTSLLLIAALVLALFRVLAQECGLRQVGACVAAAMLLAASSCLKSNIVVPVGLFLILLALLECRRQRSLRPLRGWVLMLAIGGACLLPWMLAAHASSGTYFFPILGAGNRSLPALALHMPLGTALKVMAFGMLCIAAACLLFLGSGRQHVSRREAAAAFNFAAGAGAIVFGLGTSGVGFARQPYPIMFPAILLFILLTLQATESRVILQRLSRVFAWLLLLGLALGGAAWGWMHGGLGQDLANIRAGIADQPLVSAEQRHTLAALQDSIPQGARMVVSVKRPFLFDFRRNEIWGTDIAGVWAPPPGLPRELTPEALLAVLRANHVRYVAFEFRGELNAEAVKMLPTVNVWTALNIRRQMDFQDALLKLAARYRRIYDDGENWVLDLEVPTAGVPQF